MSEKSKIVLEILDLSNSFEGKPLLQNVNFSLQRGEILCLLGPSGSGKTTLLRIIAGLEEQESGAVIFGGRNIGPVPPHKRKIGMMFQEYALFPHKNVRQNIAFGLEMQKVPGAVQSQKIESILNLVGLAGFEHRSVSELSGGERQRVALARSLVPEPDLLLLDEPLGSLDRTLRDRLVVEIRTILKKVGVTAVFVTHDQTEAFTVADKVAILRQGVLQQFATPEHLYRSPVNKSVAAFLGFSNFIDGEVDEDGRFCCSVKGMRKSALFQPGRKRKGTLLIRPDGCAIFTEAANRSQPDLVGRIIHARFQGAVYRIEVNAGNCRLTFNLPIDPQPPVAGERIELCINPAACTLLQEQ